MNMLTQHELIECINAIQNRLAAIDRPYPGTRDDAARDRTYLADLRLALTHAHD